MSMTDYSDLERDILDVPDQKILANDTEVRVRIIKIDSKVIDKEEKDTYGAEYHNITFDTPEEPNCPMFNHFLWDPKSKDKFSEKQYMDALRAFKEFILAFQIDLSKPFSWDELVGLEAFAIVKVIKDKTGEYPDKNGIKRFIIPR